jgi:virginiamycin B lyase
MAVALVVMAHTAAAAAVTVSELPVLPHPDSVPGGVTGGPDGAVWFAELGGGRIGRLAPAGGLDEYTLPGADDSPTSIASGPDGNLWFTESASDAIGRITPAGAIAEYGGIVSGGAPQDIALGPDGNLWFTEAGYNTGNRIGRMTPQGSLQEFCIRTCNAPVALADQGLHPTGIVAGPDGRVWFAEANPATGDGKPGPYGDAGAGYIGAASPDGTVHEYPVPTPNAQPTDITVGADGALWFTERAAGRIGRITTAGAVTEFPIPRPPDANWITQSSWPTAIARGPDGAVWFVENHANRIGRIDVSGALSHWAIPSGNSNPGGIGAGPDGRMYFTEASGNRLGAVTTDHVAGGDGPPSGTPPGGPTPGAGATVTRARARLVLAVRWPARGRLAVRGSLVPRRGTDLRAACARGLVDLRVRRGHRQVAWRRLHVSRRCGFAATIALGRFAGRRGERLTLVLRFAGTAGLKPLTATRRVPAP